MSIDNIVGIESHHSYPSGQVDLLRPHQPHQIFGLLSVSILDLIDPTGFWSTKHLKNLALTSVTYMWIVQ